jgi:hypothetical protein
MKLGPSAGQVMVSYDRRDTVNLAVCLKGGRRQNVIEASEYSPGVQLPVVLTVQVPVEPQVAFGAPADDDGTKLGLHTALQVTPALRSAQLGHEKAPLVAGGLPLHTVSEGPATHHQTPSQPI